MSPFLYENGGAIQKDELKTVVNSVLQDLDIVIKETIHFLNVLPKGKHDQKVWGPVEKGPIYNS